jgi:hypothetical protein
MMSRSRLAALLMLCVASALAPALARAQSPAELGKVRFERGVKHYNLGRFPEAIAEFEQAYDIDPAPILLFNIAQCHRQTGNKERALFFYRRYLEQAPNAPNRNDVEMRVKDLTQSLQEEKELKQKPPTEVASTAAGAPTAGPGPGGVPPSAVAQPGAPPTGVVATTATTAPTAPFAPAAGQEPRWLITAFVGPSFASLSGRPVDMPVLLTARVGGSYVLRLPVGSLALGAEGLVALLPYTTTEATPRESQSSLLGFLAAARLMRALTPKLTVGGGLGVGVLWWSGLGENNPFVDQDIDVNGAVPMPTFELGLRGEWTMRPDFFLAFAPQALYSIPTSGLSNGFDGLWRLDVTVGAGYRF